MAADKKKKNKQGRRTDGGDRTGFLPEEDPPAKRGGFFGRFNARLNDAIASSRGGAAQQEAPADTAGGGAPSGRAAPAPPRPSAAGPPPAAPPSRSQAPQQEAPSGGLFSRRATQAPPPSKPMQTTGFRPERTPGVKRMIIPEGTTIEGSIKGSSDTEISGKVEGDVTIEGRLYLGGSAMVTGNIRATSCTIEGEIAGKIECKEDLEIGQSGKINSDAIAGRRIEIAGQVFGNVATPGVLRLAATSRVKGDLRVRSLVIEEGAMLNGACQMRSPAQQKSAK